MIAVITARSSPPARGRFDATGEIQIALGQPTGVVTRQRDAQLVVTNVEVGVVVRRLGWSELKHATAFCVLLIATFVLARQR